MPQVVDDFKETVFWIQQRSWTYEFISVVTAYPDLCKLKPDKNPSMSGRDGHKVPSLAEELLTIVMLWDLENQISLMVHYLTYFHSPGQASPPKSSWAIQTGFNRCEETLRSRIVQGGGVHLGGVGAWGWISPSPPTLYGILKELIKHYLKYPNW